MKSNTIKFLIPLIIGATIMFFIKDHSVKEVKVPFKVEIPIKVIEKQFDSIPYPVPVYVTETITDTSLVKEYEKANDSLKKELFNKAVKINNYEEKFEDTIQTITVKAQTTGTLNSLSVKYKTKPRTITLDTTLTVKVPDNKKSLSLYGEVGVPTTLPISLDYSAKRTMALKVGIDFKTKKNWVYGVSYDTDKRAWIKLGKSFNF